MQRQQGILISTKMSLSAVRYCSILLLLLSSCTNSQPDPSKRTELPSQPIRSSSDYRGVFTLLDDRRLSLKDYNGFVTILDFYATWCQPCREEAPHLVRLQNEYGQRGLRIVGLNVGGADDYFKVPDFVKEFGIQYELGFPDKEMQEQFLSDNDTIPQTFVFDRQGRMVKRFIGYNQDVPAQLQSLIDQLL
jgi:thiol-disulfide isomerase/thioredoxin